MSITLNKELNDKIAKIYYILVDTEKHPINEYKTLYDFAQEHYIFKEFLLYYIDRVIKYIWIFRSELLFIKDSVKNNIFYENIDQNDINKYDFPENELLKKIIKNEEIIYDSYDFITLNGDKHFIRNLIQKYGSYNNYTEELYSLNSISYDVFNKLEHKEKYSNNTSRLNDFIQPWCYTEFYNKMIFTIHIPILSENFDKIDYINNNNNGDDIVNTRKIKYVPDVIYYGIYNTDKIFIEKIIDDIINDYDENRVAGYFNNEAIKKNLLEELYKIINYMPKIYYIITKFNDMDTIRKYVHNRHTINNNDNEETKLNPCYDEYYGSCIENNNLEIFIDRYLNGKGGRATNGEWVFYKAAKLGAERIFNYLLLNGESYKHEKYMSKCVFGGRNTQIITWYLTHNNNMNPTNELTYAAEVYNFDVFSYLIDNYNPVVKYLRLLRPSRYIKSVLPMNTLLYRNDVFNDNDLINLFNDLFNLN